MRRTVAVAALGATSLAALAGCTPAVPEVATAAEPAETAAVVETQVDRIVPATFEELAAADEALDASLLDARVTGTAKAVRRAQYTQADAGVNNAVEEIPSTLQATYVSAATGWPRIMAGVTEAPEDATPVVALWVQEDVESAYQMVEWAHMIPGATLPAMPGVATGATQLPLDTDTLSISPEDAIADYVTLLQKGAKNDLNDQFAPDSYRERLFAARKVLTQTAKKGDGTYVDTVQPRMDDAYAFETADGGALVFAPLRITSSLAVKGGATVSVPKRARALADGKLDDKVSLYYRDFVVIHIPADAEEQPAVVAADHHLIRLDAK